MATKPDLLLADPAIEWYSERGFSGRLGFGKRPALVVVDLQRAFTDPTMPLGADQSREIDVANRIVAAFRYRDLPIVFLAIEYTEPGCADAGVWLYKNKGVSTLAAGSEGCDMDQRLDHRDGDTTVYRRYPSGFFGTDLASRLNRHRVDTTVIVGCTTSGCVRATVVDALSYGFRPIVVWDAVADRSEVAHKQSLVDIQTKYGDVVGSTEVLKHIDEAQLDEYPGAPPRE